MVPAASMRRTSGVATPLTTGAPRPRPTLMMRSSLPCAPGARVNITPAARASTIRCTTSAMPTSRTPCAARYANARPLAIEAHTCRTASRSASAPRTPSTLSASPAIETSAPSSHVALERTARPQGERARGRARARAAPRRALAGAGPRGSAVAPGQPAGTPRAPWPRGGAPEARNPPEAPGWRGRMRTRARRPRRARRTRGARATRGALPCPRRRADRRRRGAARAHRAGQGTCSRSSSAPWPGAFARW